MGGAGTSGKGAGGPAAPVDFGEAAEKEAVSTDSQGDAIMLDKGIFQFNKVGHKLVTLAPHPPFLPLLALYRQFFGSLLAEGVSHRCSFS